MSGGVPAGWVLVPVEPTVEMIRACGRNEDGGLVTPGYRVAIWSAMLSAVPTPTPPIEGRDADVEREARFLLDRLVDHEVRMTSEEDAREWHGHVTPSMARLRAALQALGERG